MFDTILLELASIRIRQRRILSALKENNILDWDGEINVLTDPEVKKIYNELLSDLIYEMDRHKDLGGRK
jgi:hypothetical protein